MKNIIFVLIALIIIFGAWLLYKKPSVAPTIDYTTVNNNSTTTTTTTGLTEGSIAIDTPKANSTTTSPVALSGRARGNWFFEATAPVSLLDSTGKVLAQGVITATGDWMTTDYVPFTGSLTYTKPLATTTGFVLFMNDNPSGDPARSVSVKVPVVIGR